MQASAPPVASFKVNNSGGEVNEGVALKLSNTSTNADSYLWDFGNGKTSNLKEPAYIYDHCGIYTVKLAVTDANGNTATASRELIVSCVFGNPNHAPLF